MTNEQSVLYKVSQKVAHITMNRPEAMNAMSRGMITELRKTLERAQNDPEAALIVLAGADANFCAGDDLKEAEQQTTEEFLALIMDLQRLTRLLMSEKPTIAAMDGYAVGGGFELALACDFRVATTRVRMGCVETRVGMVITGGTSVLLPHLVGQALAREIVFMADVFDAATAERMGLLHRLVDPASLNSEVQTLADKLLSRAPLAVRESKRLLNRPLETELERAFQNELEAIMRCFSTTDAHEAAVAFREKRPPIFRGK
ncbi:MAG TPA: enoyl-CoA hydratase/isomerase family protein [Ktedonobacteraceae bacterium]|nr:enoyl-CoA hydratase/isomerase family protein [Ktedonobacteraceae bacterium]